MKTKLALIAMLIVSMLVRWLFISSPLPADWTPQSMIGYTATMLERPEYTDSKTIIRQGRWVIKLNGYAVIIPGDRVTFTGKATPILLMKRAVKINMEDPTFEVIDQRVCRGEMTRTCIFIQLGNFRERCVDILEKNLPSPMSSLAAGILLGVKGGMSSDFYQQLVATGTLHIVAASGFNVMIVASVLMRIVKTMFSRGVAIAAGVGGIIFYVFLSGASASVVRAGIMGSLTLIAYYFGRPTEAKRLLWVSAALMMLYDPLIIGDVGYQLSVAATAGLLYIPFNNQLPNPNNQTKNLILKNNQYLNIAREFLASYLYPTLAATVATTPIIYYHFGRVSLISPWVNMLILPVIPLIMLLSALTLVGGQVLAWVAYPLLWWVVAIIRFYGG